MAKKLSEKQLFDARGSRRGSFKNTRYIEEQKEDLRRLDLLLSAVSDSDLKLLVSTEAINQIENLFEMRRVVRRLIDCGVI